MHIKNLIIALNKSNLDFDLSIIAQLWKANDHIPEQVIDSLLTALESSSKDHPDILFLLLAECGPKYTIEVNYDSSEEYVII